VTHKKREHRLEDVWKYGEGQKRLGKSTEHKANHGNKALTPLDFLASIIAHLLIPPAD
jgi:hypothetical protein